MPFVTAEDGVRLHYRAAGRARRGQPALVFVHGWCSNLEHWAPVMDAFAATHRVVGFDLRGHGRSDAPPRGYTMRRFADDMAAVADAAGVKSAVVVGHSLGGVATVEAGRRHPDLVRALVLAETPLARYVPAARLRTSPAYRMVFDPPGQGGIEALYGGFVSDPRDAAFGQRLLEDACRTPRHVARESWRGMLSLNVPAAAKHVRQPVLYINASEQGRGSAEAFSAVFPHGVFAQVAGAGHFVQLEVPDQVTAMVRRFLDRLE